MAEASQYAFKFKEVAEALLKHQGIHDGVWAVYLRFGIKAINIGSTDDDYLPTAVVPVLEIGLSKAESVTNISVDAAVVNPDPDRPRVIAHRKLLPSKRTKKP